MRRNYAIAHNVYSRGHTAFNKTNEIVETNDDDIKIRFR